MKSVIIIGGGPAGLIAAIQLARKNIHSTVIEKREYPLHRVCGEYVSNEVMPFLRTAGLFPDEFAPPAIQRFQLSDTRGNSQFLPLDLGGFGISRYAFDHFLYRHALQLGVSFLLNTTTDGIHFRDEKFYMQAGSRSLEADVVIGAYGKRSRLDTVLHRPFTEHRSPFMAVKYHLKSDFPDNLIALHNFEGGYCGISRVENNVVNMCYLAHREVVRKTGSLREFERKIMGKNNLLNAVFNNADFVFPKPLVINEISFATKNALENHIIMIGDSAGMIAPLCGNGIAMAIRGGKLAAEVVASFCTDPAASRTAMEEDYVRLWNRHFRKRLWMGRQMQQLFGYRVASGLAVNMAQRIKPLAQLLIRLSHGQPFE